eukprot:10009-Heterococcus_DN1.PRE.1
MRNNVKVYTIATCSICSTPALYIAPAVCVAVFAVRVQAVSTTRDPTAAVIAPPSVLEAPLVNSKASSIKVLPCKTLKSCVLCMPSIVALTDDPVIVNWVPVPTVIASAMTTDPSHTADTFTLGQAAALLNV